MKFVDRVIKTKIKSKIKVINHPLDMKVCYLSDRVLRYGCLVYNASDLPEDSRVNGSYSPNPIANFGDLVKNNSKYSPTL